MGLGRVTCVSVALILSPGGAPEAVAQSVSESALKAAFLLNFAKFAEWPADALPPAKPLNLCVLDDPAVADVLVELAKGHAVENHDLVVVRPGPADAMRDCQLLYVPNLDSRQSVKVLETLKGAAVFTIGDREEFARLGGVGYLFLESGKMRFAINIQSAQRARVQLSSKLLTLAKIVRDGPNAIQH
jgi:hypothetical protein